VSDDPLRERLDAVAGLSVRAPRREYTTDALWLGAATLRRREGDGRWEALTLRLTPEAAAASGRAGGSTAATVEFALDQWLSTGEFAGFGAGLRDLLAEHALLSRPEWLTDASADPPAIDGPSREALARLRNALERVTGQWAPCPACAPPRPAGRAGYGALAELLGARLPMLRRLGIDVSDLAEEIAPPAVECPHAKMRKEAFRALYAAFPELAFEATQVLSAAPALTPPRFLMTAMMMREAVRGWLGPLRDDDDDVEAAGGATGGRELGLDEVTIAPATRAALGLSARAWGFAGPLAGLVATANESGEGMPTLTAAAAPDVALLWPEGVARVAPPAETKKAAPKAKAAAKAPAKAPAKKKKPKAKKKKAVAEKVVPAAPTAGQEFMTKELRQRGYSDAEISKMLTDGKIERVGFGWYRWKG
jgi:hypothetical protein